MKTGNRRSFLLKGLFSIVAGVSITVFVYGQTQTTTPTPAPNGGAVDIFTVYDGITLRKGEYTFSAAYSNFDPEVQTLRLASKLMAREMSYRVILPANYSDSKDSAIRYPIIYLLHGLSGHYDNWTDKTKLSEYAALHKFIIVTPEGDDGWYTDSATVPNDKYESYIVKELIPEIDKKFRTIADRDHRAIAGLSMGGYGSIKFGLKYTEMFSLVGSFSGALGAATVTEKDFGAANAITKTIMSVYGPDDSDTRKQNDIFSLIREITPEKLKFLPFIYQSCGTEDFLFQNNRDFDALMIEKKIPHEFREHPGGHTWTFWDDQVREFLDVAERKIRK